MLFACGSFHYHNPLRAMRSDDILVGLVRRSLGVLRDTTDLLDHEIHNGEVVGPQAYEQAQQLRDAIDCLVDEIQACSLSMISENHVDA